MAHQRVILLEFNELCPGLVDKFIEQGHLPHFKQLRDQADCYTTDANCEVEYLEPWIQWITMHTGLPFEKHKVFRLGQSDQLEHDSIWDVMSRHQKKSWICGSMNVKVDEGDKNTWMLPDPWTLDGKSSPVALNPFYKFVRANVQEHTNEGFSLSAREHLEFLSFMLKHGLSFSTVSAILKQLIKQVKKAPDRWKKATLLDSLQWDVFAHVYKKESPEFATFFSNSTAHFQHKFWRYMEPEKFSVVLKEEDVQAYRDAILYGYQNHDALIGKALALADENTSIILASALSQQPYTIKEEEGGRRFHRPHDIQAVAKQLGLPGVQKLSPVMSHQFHMFCESEERAKQNYELMLEAKVDGEPLFSVRHEGKDIFGGCRIAQPLQGTETITIGETSVPFSEVFYLADNLKSGCHHPHGIFWVSKAGRSHNKVDTLLPLEQSTALILQELGIDEALGDARAA